VRQKEWVSFPFECLMFLFHILSHSSPTVAFLTVSYPCVRNCANVQDPRQQSGSSACESNGHEGKHTGSSQFFTTASV
jgi:hypothetical protein